MADSTIDLVEYERLVRLARQAHPDWREGQTRVNVLYEFAPIICKETEADHIDCFYRDDMIPGFMEFVSTRMLTSTNRDSNSDSSNDG